MARAVVVTYLLALSIVLSSGYKDECAVGPAYWCKSFETAQDCGALRHCTDTVWRYDQKSTGVESSTNCEWCEKILENTHQGIQHLANNENLIRESLVKGCQLFPFSSVSSKCSNALERYGSSVGSLMKYKRYATLCRLMDICSTETATPTTEKPRIVGSSRCTWGPSYWCSSLSNSRECSSIQHCSNKIWSQQSIEKKPEDNLCQYCESTISKLRSIIEEKKTDIDVEKWLSGACSMLPTKEAIDECVKVMSQYADEILVLIKTNIDPGVICHLAHMCKDATIRTRVTIESTEPQGKTVVEYESEQSKGTPIDEDSKMLCNVLVRATYELHVNQKKTRNEIEEFLKNDCQNLATPELVRKCDGLVDKHGIDIHGQVASHIELSKICDYIGDFADHSAVQALPKVHCELCTFVLTTAKYMLDAKQTEDKILLFIDEQICSRSTGSAKKVCKQIIETKGKDLINDIECGTKSMLLCTRFQICIDETLSPTSSITKNDKNEFLKENICDTLGTFKEACNALIEKDANRLMHTLFNDMDGDVLCGMFGICPKKMSLIDNLSVNDDTNKCKRCLDDFTRRKHIAEKLVNHSSEFLHHLCGQLPQKDDCVKAVDDSINELVTFIQSVDPQDICEKLDYCNKTLLARVKAVELTSSNDVISLQLILKRDSINCTLCKLAFQTMKSSLLMNKTEQEVAIYIKTAICSKLGSLSEMCDRTVDAEVPAILAMIARNIDPKKACTTLGICTGSTSFENCNDKCECCMDKIEIHEVQVATFLRAMVESIRTLCQHMPGNAQCLQMTARFDANVNKITSRFNSKKVCQLLTHCSASPVEIETLSQCQIRVESKKQFLLSAISSINQNLKSLCEYIPWNKDCYSIIDRSTLDSREKVSQLSAETACTSGQSLADLMCIKASPFESLCKQLAVSDENNLRMEAIFKSMFNQNGNLEKELCELESTNCPSPVMNLNNCKDKCDCCVQLYTTQKDYNLKMIETYRSGLLATCDWSLSKDYCTPWFNRVCDRMKAKVDQFIPATYCKNIGQCSNENDQCEANVDKCQCCKNRFNGRTNRFRTIVSEVTNSLVSLCTDNDCRSMVQSAQQQTLAQIDRVDTETYCQRYGYCSTQASVYMSRSIANHIGSDIEAIDQRFEAAISSDICFQYGQLRPMCEQLMASPQGHRYNYVYLALLKNDRKLIDDDLREQVQTKANADVCDSCKNAVQSSKDFWKNALESVRNVLVRTCERCSVKEQCRSYLNQRFDTLKAYVDTIDPNQFCQNIHLCSTTSVIVIDTDTCSTCVQSLQSKKEVILQAVNRVAAYFDELCQRFAGTECQTFVKQIQTAIQQSIQNADPKKICTLIGFCSTMNEASQMDFDAYEKYLEDEIDKNVCSTLGPFESLCKQTIRGNRKQVQTVKINFNIKDLMQLGQTENLFTAANLNQCNQDKCQCCVDRINQKKTCLKNTGDKVISALSSSCNLCPAKGQCQKFWSDSQSKYDAWIDDIDAKQVCTRLGFCNASALCAKMGMYRQACEETLNAFIHDTKTLEEHLPHTSVVVLPTKPKGEITMDSNSTCILCEYVMNILSNYIHEKSTQEEIEQALEKVCDQMPASIRNPCHEFVENYAPAIIATLLVEFDVKIVCRKLNLCTGQMKVELTHMTKASIASCGVCDYVSTYIDFALKRDPSDQSLQHALSTVCTHLSSEQIPQCQTLVQLFTPYVRKLKLQLGNNFCKQLIMCQTEEKKTGIIHVPLVRSNLPRDPELLRKMIIENIDETRPCLVCHYVIGYLDGFLKANQSEKIIETALNIVCHALPIFVRGTCTDLVKTYLPMLVELLAQALDPTTICHYIGMCQATLPEVTSTTSTAITYGNHDYAVLPKHQAELTCMICQFIIGRMKHFVAENQTEEEVLASLRKSCELFSVLKLKQECEAFLDQYGPYIIQMIASDVQPKVACQSMGICDKSLAVSTSSTRRQSTPSTPSSSTRYGKCIYGISYWCTSRQNAELCNAVELCERQVWSKKNKKIVI